MHITFDTINSGTEVPVYMRNNSNKNEEPTKMSCMRQKPSDTKLLSTPANLPKPAMDNRLECVLKNLKTIYNTK